jgi:hypothetical protein
LLRGWIRRGNEQLNAGNGKSQEGRGVPLVSINLLHDFDRNGKIAVLAWKIPANINWNSKPACRGKPKEKKDVTD